MTTSEDRQLMEDCGAGDENAFEKLVQKYLTPTYTYIYYFTGNAEEASDITQDTFVKAWKNLKKYNPSYSVKTWLFSIARNTAIDWFRKKRPLTFSQLNNDDEPDFETKIMDDSPTAEDIFESKETQHLVQKALTEIPLRQREIVAMHMQEGLTFEEISNILNKPLNTIKSDYRRALQLLKKTIEIAPN